MEGMGGNVQGMTPLMCLCQLYEATKLSPLDYAGHAACEAMFNVTREFIEKTQAKKPAKKQKAAPSRRARKKPSRK